MSFEEVLGQSHIIRRFKNAIAKGRLAHGFIFSGPRGCGKTTLGLALAKQLLCDRKAVPECSCNQCLKLRMTEDGHVSHGDVHILSPHVQTIRAELIRSELVDRVHLHPVEGKYKFFIIQDAERMAPAASNAFLKTLEEPPPDTIIILESYRPELFLDTILSRCQIVRLAPLSKGEFIDALKKREPEVKAADARSLWSFTNGSLGEALRLLEEEWLENAEEFLSMFAASHIIDPFDFAEKAGKNTSGVNLESQRKNVIALLDFASEQLMCRFRSICENEHASGCHEATRIEEAIGSLFTAKEMIRNNIRVESLLERLARGFTEPVLLDTGKK